MALGGSYEDFHLEQFKDTLDMELQQRGSVLEQTVTMEMVEGLQTLMTKIGKATSYAKTSRNQPKQYQDPSYERRVLTCSGVEADYSSDRTDILNQVRDPKPELITNLVMEMGRKTDAVIRDALTGNASVITNGSTSTQALVIASPIDNQIAVNAGAYDGNSSNVGLTPGKLKGAIALLSQAEVDVNVEQVFCVSNGAQLMNLKRDGNTEITSGDFRSGKPLEGPGVVHGLSGYLGIAGFIRYEHFAQVSSKDVAYVYAKSAVKLGVREALTVRVGEREDLSMHPMYISAWKDLGAVRMFEEKVIEILCEPITPAA